MEFCQINIIILLQIYVKNTKHNKLFSCKLGNCSTLSLEKIFSSMWIYAATHILFIHLTFIEHVTYTENRTTNNLKDPTTLNCNAILIYWKNSAWACVLIYMVNVSCSVHYHYWCVTLYYITEIFYITDVYCIWMAQKLFFCVSVDVKAIKLIYEIH